MPDARFGSVRLSGLLHEQPGARGLLLIVHGMMDDNVHMQNTLQMVQALITAQQPFDLQLYPRKTHGIAGAVPRTHLFHRIQQHFEQNLLNPPPAKVH